MAGTQHSVPLRAYVRSPSGKVVMTNAPQIVSTFHDLLELLWDGEEYVGKRA